MSVRLAPKLLRSSSSIKMIGLKFSVGGSRVLLAAIVFSALTMMVFLATAIYWLFDAARFETEGLATIVSTHVTGLIDRHNRLALTLTRGWEREGENFPFKLYSEIVNDQEFLAPQVAVADRNGIVVASSRPGGTKVDLADREHFRVHAEDRVKGLYISDPVIGRTTNRPSIQFTHRINQDGFFAGIVSLSINPEAFFAVQANLRWNVNTKNEPNSDKPILALIGQRDTILAISRTENLPVRYRDWFTKTVLGARSMPSNTLAFFDFQSFSVWLISAQIIPFYNVVVLVAESANHYLAIAIAVLLAALLAMAGLFVLLRFVVRSVQDRSNAAYGEFLQSVFTQVPAKISLFDAEGKCRFLNRNDSAGTNIEYEHLDTSKALEPRVTDMNDADRVEFLKWYRMRGDNESAKLSNSFLYWKKGPDNLDTAIALAWANIRMSGDILECWTATDVTKFMEAQLVAQHSSRLAQVGELAAGLAHEINQPLNVIALASQNLIDAVRDGCGACMRLDVRDKLTVKGTRIASQVARAAKIVNNLRVFARRDKLEVEAVDLAHQLTAAVELLSHRFRLEVIAVELSVPPETIEVVANRAALQQVFINVLSNACDSVTASQRPGERQIRCFVTRKDNSGEVVISIEDNGVGFSEAVLARVFEPFVTTKPKGKGTGLGLSIARAIILDMGGSIIAANVKPSKTGSKEWASGPVGAVVTIILPIRKIGTR